MNRQIILTALSSVLCSALLASGPTSAQQSKPARTVANPHYNAMPPTGGAPLPFSESVRIGDTLFISGQIGNLPGTLTLAPGGIAPETRQALDNIKTIVERRGGSMKQVVKCTVFVADRRNGPSLTRFTASTSSRTLRQEARWRPAGWRSTRERRLIASRSYPGRFVDIRESVAARGNGLEL